jgi:glycosyltransferase involved in cell wall biosynthesis
MANVLVIDAYAKAFLNFREQFLIDLVRQGHQVTACAPDITPSVRDVLATRGISSAKMRFNRSGIGLFGDFRSVMSLISVISSRRPHAVVLYSPKVVIYGAIAAFFARVPRRYAMITGLGYGFAASGAKGWLIRIIQCFLYAVALRMCDAVLFQNPDDLKFFRKFWILGPRVEAGVVNGSGVDLEKFPSSMPPAKPVFLMFGRLLISKGVLEYVAAASIVRRDYPQARFRLAGWLDSGNPDCVDPVTFEQLMRSGDIEFMGGLDDVRNALAECSVFVLPSFYKEGTPRSVLEALSTGRAVITTDMPGCRETVVQGENGFLVPPKNVEALAIAMSRYAEDPTLARTHGQLSRHIAVDKYDVRKVNDFVLETFCLLNPAYGSPDRGRPAI